jgi:hypothetical protein
MEFDHFVAVMDPLQPWVPRNAGVLKFTFYVCYAPKMLHAKFEKNWNGVITKKKKVSGKRI